MNIKELENELGKFGFTDIKINNDNEIYSNCDQLYIQSISLLLKKQFEFKFIAEFCTEYEEDKYHISVVFTNSKHGYFVIVRYPTEDVVVSLQDIFEQAHLFEREISDLFGLTISGGKESRKLVKHEIWQKDVYPLRKSFNYQSKVKESFEIEEYKFKQIKGDEGFQIPVGPIHAGIIEPGHFRFSAIGEEIENLEIRLNYKHRGIEKIAEHVDANKLPVLLERIACESSVAYSEAYALLIEKLLKEQVSADIKSSRVILLEMERIYNYLQDIGGICTDVGFSYPAKKLDYSAEIIKQLAERLTGSRFMRGVIIPLGINMDLKKEDLTYVKESLTKMLPRIKSIINTSLESFTFLDRVENTGIVKTKKAKKLMLTGPVARASGINYDVRKSFPYENYKELKTGNNLEEIGGVFERYKVKIAEIMDAFDFVFTSIEAIEKDIKRDRPLISLSEGMEAISIVETVKGELMVYGKVGKNNCFDRLYFKTPSFTNWMGLSEAVLDEIVPDFPLCNKSFNMSYSENDR